MLRVYGHRRWRRSPRQVSANKEKIKFLYSGSGRWRILQVFGSQKPRISPSLRTLTYGAERTLDLPRQRRHQGNALGRQRNSCWARPKRKTRGWVLWQHDIYMLYADIHNLLDSLVSLERSSRGCWYLLSRVPISTKIVDIGTLRRSSRLKISALSRRSSRLRISAPSRRYSWISALSRRLGLISTQIVDIGTL